MSDLPFNMNDDKVFDRLADGELSVAERQQLLASLDNSDGGWRRCALAFLEAQTWGQQFKQLVAEPGEKPQVQITALPIMHNSQNMRWFVIAAGIMLAFTSGWLVRTPSASDPVAGKIVEIDQQDTRPADEMPVDKFSDEDVVTLYVRDASGKNRRLRVPLVEAADLKNQSDSLWATFPAGVREQLLDSGFDVKRRRRFAPMFFEQNERVVPMVVPVDDTYIVPVSRPVY